MRKALLLIGVLLLALGITYLLLHRGSSVEKPEPRDAPLVIGSNSSAFNRSFAGVLKAYYLLSDAFVAGDSAGLKSITQKLSNAVDSVRFDKLKADTLIIQTAVNLAQSIQGDILGLNGENSMEQKKREFNMITDELYSLIRTVRYDGGVIYHMRCPMAFADSSEAYWLSADEKIVNPYLGKNHPVYKDKMLNSGEIIDSIHFATQ
jgi:Protein of unknown function (DUF3347)